MPHRHHPLRALGCCDAPRFAARRGLRRAARLMPSKWVLAAQPSPRFPQSRTRSSPPPHNGELGEQLRDPQAGGISQQKTCGHTKKSPEPVVPGILLGWQMRDSNPRRRCQLIYSQPPLAARVICRTSKEDHFRRPFLLDPVTEGRDNLTEFSAKNLIGAGRLGFRGISGFSEDPAGQFSFELFGLLGSDLVELHSAQQVRVDSVHTRSSVGNRTEDDRCRDSRGSYGTCCGNCGRTKGTCRRTKGTCCCGRGFADGLDGLAAHADPPWMRSSNWYNSRPAASVPALHAL